MDPNGAAEGFAPAEEARIESKLPCPACGARDFSWGSLFAQGINYKSDRASWIAKLFRYGSELQTRRCEACGNLQLFA